MAMRVNELRKMKAMVAYEVQKATRVKKIHSKTYRRIHNKAEKLKNDKMMMVCLSLSLVFIVVGMCLIIIVL